MNISFHVGMQYRLRSRICVCSLQSIATYSTKTKINGSLSTFHLCSLRATIFSSTASTSKQHTRTPGMSPAGLVHSRSTPCSSNPGMQQGCPRHSLDALAATTAVKMGADYLLFPCIFPFSVTIIAITLWNSRCLD